MRRTAQANLILTEVISSPLMDESGSILPTIQENPLDGEVMAVTRSKAKLKSPLNWSDQQQVREEVRERLSKERESVPSSSSIPPIADDDDDFFHELMTIPLTVTLGQLLDTVPLFKEWMLCRLKPQPVLVADPAVCGLEPADVDFRVPIIQVEFQSKLFSNVLLDGIFGFNILLEVEYHKLSDVTLHPAPFQVKMADQRHIQPLGLLCGQEICIASLSFKVTFAVLCMADIGGAYSMLLGRPLLYCMSEARLGY